MVDENCDYPFFKDCSFIYATGLPAFNNEMIAPDNNTEEPQESEEE